MRFFVTNQSRRSHSLRVQPANDYMTVQFKPLKCAIDVSVHGAFGVWSWAALTSRFIARGVRHRDEHLYVTNDANLWSAKMQYSVRIGSIFSCLFPHPHAWEQFYAASEMYLRRCSHMPGC